MFRNKNVTKKIWRFSHSILFCWLGAVLFYFSNRNDFWRKIKYSLYGKQSSFVCEFNAFWDLPRIANLFSLVSFHKMKCHWITFSAGFAKKKQPEKIYDVIWNAKERNMHEKYQIESEKNCFVVQILISEWNKIK